MRGPGPNGVSACDIDEVIRLTTVANDDSQFHEVLQVVKRLTGMASRDESELFDRYKRVSISDGTGQGTES